MATTYQQRVPVLFGTGAIEEMAQKISQAGLKRAFLICDKGVRDAGAADKIVTALQSQRVNAFIFDQCIADTPDSFVNDVAKRANDWGADLLIGVGGGSSMDTAKAAGVVMDNGRPLATFMEENGNPGFKVITPVYVVPTAAGTGSECTQMCVIHDTASDTKKVVLRCAQWAVLDPSLTTTCPTSVTVNSGMDALSHAIEAYTSVNPNPKDKILAIYAIKLISENLYTCVQLICCTERGGNAMMEKHSDIEKMKELVSEAQKLNLVTEETCDAVYKVIYLLKTIESEIVFNEEIILVYQAYQETLKTLRTLLEENEKLIEFFEKKTASYEAAESESVRIIAKAERPVNKFSGSLSSERGGDSDLKRMGSLAPGRIGSPAPERMGSPASARMGSPAPERMARPGSAMRADPGRLLQEERTRAEISKVYFSAVAPRTFKKNEYTMVHLAMYEKEFRNIVDEIKADYDTDVKETKSGALKVTEEDAVRVVLSSPDAEIEDNEEVQIWQGEYLIFDFAVKLPADFAGKQILFTAAVYINDIIATKLKFLAKISSWRQQKIRTDREDILSAFVSYASQDRNRVARIIQGMRKARPDMDIFFDVENLRSGESWQNALRSEIDRRDILFLCWSHFARQSKWVDTEWRYAFSHKGEDCIEPIPLESPSVCPPPEELSRKHFNDKMLFIINGGNAEDFLRQGYPGDEGNG